MKSGCNPTLGSRIVDELANHLSPGKVLGQMIKQKILNYGNVTVIKRARKKMWQVSPISFFEGLIGLVNNRREIDMFQLEQDF